jgi:hypothetical protein
MTIRSILSRIMRLEQVHHPELMTVIITGGLRGKVDPSPEQIALAQAEARADGRRFCFIGGLRQAAEARRAER